MISEYLYVGPRRVSERKYVKASDGSTEVTTLHAMYDPSALLRTGGVAAITRWYHDKSDNSVVVGFQYGRDKVGTPNYELREHQSSYGDEYEFDNLYRLTRTVYDDTSPETPTASPSATTTDDYMYDDIGNRTKCYLKSTNDTTYLANTVNEYTKSTLSGTDSLYNSDAAGNLTRIAAAAGSNTDGDWRFYYDYENALTKAEKYVTDAWVTQGEYVRDANGRRVVKVADGTTIRYYYDGMRCIEETEGAGSPTVERQYVFGNGIDEALVMYDENGGGYDAYYYLADPLWTVEALVDESADIVEAYAYRAYGEPTIKTADGGDGDWFDGDETTATSSACSNTITFTGRQYDPETGMYYFRARIYDPLRGRFTSADPIGYEDGMNLYEYVRSSPTNYVDWNGAQASQPGSPDAGSQSAGTTTTAAASLGIKWTPNTDTGNNIKPWGTGPNGDVLQAKTDAGTTVSIWRPHDGTTYWCHGYTFDGHIAQGGPYSIWGDTVPTVLQDGGWKQIPCSWTVQKKDIVVFWRGGLLTHSGKVWADMACEWPGMRLAEGVTKIRSKWGSLALNTSTFAANVQSYGKYRCYSQQADERNAFAKGACECWGANELKP